MLANCVRLNRLSRNFDQLRAPKILVAMFDAVEYQKIIKSVDEKISKIRVTKQHSRR